MITALNKAYNMLKKQGQEFPDKSKVEQLTKRIKNPMKNIQIIMTSSKCWRSNVMTTVNMQSKKHSVQGSWERKNAKSFLPLHLN